MLIKPIISPRCGDTNFYNIRHRRKNSPIFIFQLQFQPVRDLDAYYAPQQNRNHSTEQHSKSQPHNLKVMPERERQNVENNTEYQEYCETPRNDRTQRKMERE